MARIAGTVKYGIYKSILLLSSLVPALCIPLRLHAKELINNINEDKLSETDENTGSHMYLNICISIVLVLLGGVMAGLTLALMGQDTVYLKVIGQSGEPHERTAAKKVLKLLDKGKHWVLVTLLLGNVITNETLPIVLDNCLGGGWLAVVFSTVSIVIFGEIIPQSVCVRYGLSIGAAFTPFVLFLMYLMYPVAYPTSMLLDYLLGEDHGTIYKRAGLKSLVTLHKSMGTAVERLNEDEVVIISAVLDLKSKPVQHVMTPIKDVYTLSSDTILNDPTIEEILNTGFNRIPIHVPNEPTNFIGMLLVRILISYDPEDSLPISSFPLATLPETNTHTSCLNILNYFQEGRSHMMVVSETPGEPTGALGVVTLEDVIEELIGEEIVDESDVYVDVHNAIRRIEPGPLSKSKLKTYYAQLQRYGSNQSTSGNNYNSILQDINDNSISNNQFNGIPKLGPSNKASNPLITANPNVTIKKASVDPKVQKSMINNPLTSILGGTKTGGNNCNSMKKTEKDVVKEAHLQHKDKYRTPNERDSLLEHADGRYTDDQVHDLDHEDIEHRRYRTGGIVESVRQVHGIHKTVVESDETLR